MCRSHSETLEALQTLITVPLLKQLSQTNPLASCRTKALEAPSWTCTEPGVGQRTKRAIHNAVQTFTLEVALEAVRACSRHQRCRPATRLPSHWDGTSWAKPLVQPHPPTQENSGRALGVSLLMRALAQCEKSVGTVMWWKISLVTPPNTTSRMRE
jgi:hypothetical protein